MNTRRRLNGVVTSNKMDKTVIVEVTRTYMHRLYKKVVNSRNRVMAHDELDCQIGDHVSIVESKPISRHKRWVVEEITRREIGAGAPDIEEDILAISEQEAEEENSAISEPESEEENSAIPEPEAEQ